MSMHQSSNQYNHNRIQTTMSKTVETEEIRLIIWEAMWETTTVVMLKIKIKILEMLVLNLVMVVMAVTRMIGILMMEVTMELVRIRTTTVVIGGIKEIGVETGTTTITGTTKISIMVAIMTTIMCSEIKALGINTEGIQMVDSTMQMEDTTTKLGEYDDASPILFEEGNEHHAELSPRSFNQNYNQGGNYNNNGNFNNNSHQGNYQNQNQSKQFQQSNFNQGGTSKKEEIDGNKLEKTMDFITQTYQKVDTNSKSTATIEKQIPQLAEKIGKRKDGKFPSTTTVNPSHNQRPGKKHQVNEVITLHSGKKVDNKVSAPTLDNDSDTEVIFDKKKEEFDKGFKFKKQKATKGKDDSKVGEHGVEINTGPYPSALEKPASFPFRK
ncbi:unnamed protein product [Lactuca saligna]|uniref:Uncharacterized protein n=1 Tax=Lactuca saligna TaxID=75948 RepID=A0AA36E582_LACSI|nr:unnamed protein product [Lactuca saligna]